MYFTVVSGRAIWYKAAAFIAIRTVCVYFSARTGCQKDDYIGF